MIGTPRHLETAQEPGLRYRLATMITGTQKGIFAELF
jgi:hypothetical protein